MSMLDEGLAGSVSAVWRALHRDAEFIIHEDQIHYLKMLALAADDEFVSHLLLRKLQSARFAKGTSIPDSFVALNSFCEFSFDGGPQRFCQLVHPSPHAPNYGLSMQSLPGAGLIGLREGQTILWPDENGTLCDLYVARVENCPGITDWLGDVPRKDRVNV
jgi:regulator of nucleoside diphosphate kinase